MVRMSRNSLKAKAYLDTLTLYSRGYNQMQISSKLKISQPVISRWISMIHRESLDMLPEYITRIVPFEIRRSLITYNEVQLRANEMYDNTQDPRVKQLALSLIMNVTSERNQLLSAVHGVNEAIITIKSQMLEEGNRKCDRLLTEAEKSEAGRIKVLLPKLKEEVPSRMEDIKDLEKDVENTLASTDIQQTPPIEVEAVTEKEPVTLLPSEEEQGRQD